MRSFILTIINFLFLFPLSAQQMTSSQLNFFSVDTVRTAGAMGLIDVHPDSLVETDYYFLETFVSDSLLIRNDISNENLLVGSEVTGIQESDTTLNNQQVEDTVRAKSIHIEVLDLPGQYIAYSQNLTIQELRLNGYLDQWNLSFPIGFLSNQSLVSTFKKSPKQATLTIQYTDGTYSRTIKKTINQ